LRAGSSHSGVIHWGWASYSNVTNKLLLRKKCIALIK
jgi:hypothetical protein